MDYEKGYVYELMDQGGPTDVREAYFKDAVDEMMRASTLCAKANACMRQSKESFFQSVQNGELNYFSAEHDEIIVKIDGDRATIVCNLIKHCTNDLNTSYFVQNK